MLRIITNIVDVSKIQSGSLEIAVTKAEVNEILDEIYEDFIEKLGKINKTHVHLQLIKGNQYGKVNIETDVEKFKQIIYHLLDNAIKFTHDGEIEFGYITDKDNAIQFYVRDTGIGIPISQIDYIFNNFTQLDYGPTRRYGGTGLGLSISKGFVEMIGGKIWITSEESIGTTVYFTVKGTIEQIYPDFVDDIQGETIQQDWSNKHLLIVEDDILNFAFLQECLEQTNVKIAHASNGQEAIDYCRNIDFDLVLMDIQLPILNGYDATKLIRSFNPNIPIIAQTANALSNDKYKCIDAGCNDYMSKPISIKTLLNTIDKFLNQNLLQKSSE